MNSKEKKKTKDYYNFNDLDEGVVAVAAAAPAPALANRWDERLLQSPPQSNNSSTDYDSDDETD